MSAITRVKEFLRAPMFSPAGFVIRAAVFGLLYFVLTLAGVREYTSALSLTYPEGTSQSWAAFWCFVYLISYFAFILGVPILLLAAGMFGLMDRLRMRRGHAPDAKTN